MKVTFKNIVIYLVLGIADGVLLDVIKFGGWLRNTATDIHNWLVYQAD